MSKIVDFPENRTKRAIETNKIADISSEDMKLYNFLAHLAKKYKSKIAENKSSEALILNVKNISLSIDTKIRQKHD